MWKANGRKRGQRDSVLHAITCHSTTRPRLFGSHFDVSQKNSMSPSNGERGQSIASMAAFFNNNERFHKKYSNA